jgi:hypothetical protein
MPAIPTLADEDAKRPGCAFQSLVGERTRIINRLKANPAHLGIRDFRLYSRVELSGRQEWSPSGGLSLSD